MQIDSLPVDNVSVIGQDLCTFFKPSVEQL